MSKREELVDVINEIRVAELDSTEFLNAVSVLAIILDIDTDHALRVVSEAKANGEW